MASIAIWSRHRPAGPMKETCYTTLSAAHIFIVLHTVVPAFVKQWNVPRGTFETRACLTTPPYPKEVHTIDNFILMSTP